MEREVRRLYTPAAGEVFPASVLNSGEAAEKSGRMGEGFAVGAAGIFRLYYRLVPAVEICAPADCAVIAAEERSFRVRMGDGLELDVALPGAAEFLLSPGDMAPAGEPVCRISREDFCRGRAGTVVTFCDSSRVTELHTLPGLKRTGALAAEYFPRPLESQDSRP